MAAKKEVRKFDKKFNNMKNIVVIVLLIGILGAATFYFSVSSENIHLSGRLWFGKIHPMVTDIWGKSWSVTENPDAGITAKLLQSYIDKNVEIDGKIITITEGVECKEGEIIPVQIGCKHDVKVVFPEKIMIIE